MPRGTAARAAEEILAAISAAAGELGTRSMEDVARPGPEQLRRQKSLRKRLTAIAGELGIQPEVLATRRELAALARGARQLPVLTEIGRAHV